MMAGYSAIIALVSICCMGVLDGGGDDGYVADDISYMEACW